MVRIKDFSELTPQEEKDILDKFNENIRDKKAYTELMLAKFIVKHKTPMPKELLEVTPTKDLLNELIRRTPDACKITVDGKATFLIQIG